MDRVLFFRKCIIGLLLLGMLVVLAIILCNYFDGIYYVNTEAVEQEQARRECTVREADFGFTFYTDNEGNIEAEVNYYFGNELEVTIPDEVNGYPVTSIDAEAFYNQYLVALHLGKNINWSGSRPLWYCYGPVCVTGGTEEIDLSRYYGYYLSE